MLIVAGYLHRTNAVYLTTQTRSSTYINAISNRLSASSPRASLLGMLVGAAISELVDAQGKRMIFSVDEIDTTEGKWYRSLVTIKDTIGSIDDFREEPTHTKRPPAAVVQRSTQNKQAVKVSKQEARSRIVAIEEVNEETESEDDDLVVYEKPDSDASDEDDDPTLVQRAKPTAPV